MRVTFLEQCMICQTLSHIQNHGVLTTALGGTYCDCTILNAKQRAVEKLSNSPIPQHLMGKRQELPLICLPPKPVPQRQARQLFRMVSPHVCVRQDLGSPSYVQGIQDDFTFPEIHHPGDFSLDCSGKLTISQFNVP